MLIRNKIIFITGSFLFSIALTTIAATTDTSFHKLTNQYFDSYYLPAHPTEATQLGIHTYDSKLEDYSKAEINRQIKELSQYEKEFSALDVKKLNEEQRADRELIINRIKSQLLTLQKIKPWEKNPDIYSSGITNSAFVIMAREFASPNDRLTLLIAREKLMPTALQEARNNLKNPPKIFTDIALEQLPGLITFFKQDVPNAFKDANNDNLKKEFAETNAAVIRALTEYQTWLKNDLLPKSHGDFKLGADTYRKKLQYDEMVDLPLEQLLQIGMKNMRQNQKALLKVAKAIDPKKSPEQILTDLNKDHPNRDQLLAAFSENFSQLISFIKKNKIITTPSDTRPIMEETPPFMRATTFASMDTPGPFEKNAKEAYFNVTLPDPNWSKEKIDKFLGALNYSRITTVAIHETYPGHYVQFLWVPNIHDKVRKIIGSSSNAEGWAHYTEQMMVDLGFGSKNLTEENKLRLAELVDALLRNARFIVAIKMHTGQMSLEQAQAFFVKEGHQTPLTALIETKRGTSDPTYLVYTLGKLQILKLRADMQKKLGDEFNLLTFHDDFMKQGFPPIKIVRKALLHDDSPTL